MDWNKSSLSDDVGISLRSVHQTLGLFVADDRARTVVPVQFPPQQEREISQHSQDGHIRSGLDIHNRFTSGFNALEPILFVPRALINLLGIGTWFPLASFAFGPGSTIATPVVKGTFRAGVQ